MITREVLDVSDGATDVAVNAGASTESQVWRSVSDHGTQCIGDVLVCVSTAPQNCDVDLMVSSDGIAFLVAERDAVAAGAVLERTYRSALGKWFKLRITNTGAGAGVFTWWMKNHLTFPT